MLESGSGEAYHATRESAGSRSTARRAACIVVDSIPTCREMSRITVRHSPERSSAGRATPSSSWRSVTPLQEEKMADAPSSEHIRISPSATCSIQNPHASLLSYHHVFPNSRSRKRDRVVEKRRLETVAFAAQPCTRRNLAIQSGQKHHRGDEVQDLFCSRATD